MMMTELEIEQAKTIEELTHQVALLTEQVQMLTKRLFGTSSEKSTKIGPGQLSIFDENAPFFKNQRQLRNKPMKRL